MADYSKHSIPELRTMKADIEAALEKKIEARKAELEAELASLSGTAPKKLGAKKAAVKAMYRSPDGYEWSGRGAVPKVFKKLGVKDKAGMAAYLIR